jgi:RHS repeat-associated protein
VASSNQESRSDSAQVRGTAPPVVRATTPSLPAGGGAIRGIGETFSASAATGTGGLVIPIPAPSARGFQPELALRYDSGAGNGPFGAGWTLPVPAIIRKTDKQLPTYLDADESDVFILAGAEDLVRVSGEEDGIRRYRPRVESGYARIERHTAGDETWWMTVTSANVRHTFGRDVRARIADPSDPGRVFSWLLERSEDALGNVIVYDYVREDLAGVGATPAELHRIDGRAAFANTYLSAIRYGNLPATDLDAAPRYAFTIAFDYGDHLALSPERADGVWPVRPDPFSRYRAGFEIRTYRRCRRVMVFHALPDPTVPRIVRSLELTYDDGVALGHLVSAELRGYDDAGQAVAVPALKLGYTQPAPPRTGTLAVDRLGDLPAGVAGGRHQWVDLDAEGIPGVLTDGDGGLFYRRNLGGGALGPARPLALAPAAAAPASGGQQLLALGGDGRLDLVAFDAPLPGFYERVPANGGEGTWDAFRPFTSLPAIAWADPDVRFIDLDGDGLDDVLVAKDDTFVWYPSLGKDGFGPPRVIPRPSDEERGPAIVFADSRHTIALADISGDGLRDLVRVENGSICYWPSLGHGRFGAKVTMANAPVFDLPDQFEPRRILFADIDGSGTSDVLYAGADGVRYWLNLAGNAWSASHEVAGLPPDHAMASVSAVDLLGTGTACLAWSSASPGDGAIRYVDLVGGVKPHLLAEVDNQLGLTTRIAYAPSTRFYLEDRAAGIHWTTRLPFPVHVVERVESYDAIRRVRFVSTYRYRDGYFDGHEREFRGFGFVEQRDTESDPAQLGIGMFADRPPAVNGEYVQPPIVTRTRFHTGAWLDHGPSGRIVVEQGLSPHESREAYRALRGLVLHQTVCVEDSISDLPFLETEHGYEVRRLVPAAGGTHGVFAAYHREAIEIHSERDPSEARVHHAVVLETDDYGHPRRSVAIGYARANGGRTEQKQLLAVLTEGDVANVVDQADWYRHGVPVETRTYELVGLPATASAPLAFEAIKAVADHAVAIPYDALPQDAPSKRLVERARTQYYNSAALPSQVPLPFGTIDRRAVPCGAFGLAFTPSLLASLYDGRMTGELLKAGGYVQLDDDPDNWWVPSGRAVPDPGAFYLPTSFLDPFGTATTVEYDDARLAVVATTDARANVTTAELDYRVLAPRRLTDANGNSSFVTFDALGRVLGLWQTGRAGEGDPADAPPTAAFDYAFYDAATGRPSVAHVAARETHAAADTRWQHSYSYSDGAGQIVMKKVPATPGPARRRRPDGTCEDIAHVDPRWIGSGRTVFDNKGHPIKQYEPYFSTTADYEDEEDLVCQGVTPVLHYDALGRLVAAEYPDGSLARVERSPWAETSHDRNDTLGDAGNPWLAHAQAGTDAQRRAAQVSLPHASTPTTTLFDVLGRAFAVIADNGNGELHETRTTFDIEGNPLVVTDALGRACFVRRFSMLGQACFQHSIDAGDRWSLVDVLGQPLWRRDARGQLIETEYDVLRRPVAVRVTPPGGPAYVAEKIVWGEDAPASVPYARGRVYQRFDGAGIATSEAYDFKGNLETSSRQLASDYHVSPDWSADPPLDAEILRITTRFDALNRPVQITAPEGSVITPRYNEAALLDRVHAVVHGTDLPLIDAIDYNEKGQRTSMLYAGAARSTFEYDRYTLRLAALNTTRTSDGHALQRLSYTYDPTGNIVQIDDAVIAPVWRDGQLTDGTARFTYGPTYRLSTATGREHAAGFAARRTEKDVPSVDLPHPNDPQLINYAETYQYDRVGNVLEIAHGPPGGAPSWRSPMQYVDGTNRLARSALDSDPDGSLGAVYTYDAHGNMTSMPHLPVIDWDWKDQMQHADLRGGGHVYFAYDAAGERVRKVWEHGGIVEERIYLGSYEVYRRRNAGKLALERQTLHVMDGVKRIAMIETKTVDTSVPALVVAPLVRFQLSNHLGSAHLELDVQGRVISYEEYHPYGTSAYRAQSSVIEVSRKRYRYTGKERDEETSLEYHGARYYAPWLATWTAPDPAGITAGINLYEYCEGNPTILHDPTGHQGTHASEGSVLSTVDATFARKGIAYNTEVTVRIRLKNGVVVIRRYDRVFVDPHDGSFKFLEAKGKDPTHLTRDQKIADRWVQEEGGEAEIIKSAGKPPRGHGAKSEMIPFTKGRKVELKPGDLQYTHGNSTFEGSPNEPNATRVGTWKEGMEGHPDVVRPPGTVMKTRPNEPPEYVTQEQAWAERARNVGPKQQPGAGIEKGTTAPEKVAGEPAVAEGGGVLGELGTGVTAFAPMIVMGWAQAQAQRNYDDAATLRDSYRGMPSADQIERQKRAGWKFTGELDDKGRPKWEYAPSLDLRLRDTTLFLFNPFDPLRRSGRKDEYVPHA